MERNQTGIPENLRNPEEIEIGQIVKEADLLTMPEVSPHAIEAYHEENNLPPPEPETNDDVIEYERDEFGEIVRNKDGSKRRKRGRKRKRKAESKSATKPPEIIIPPDSSDSPENTESDLSESYVTAFTAINIADLALCNLISPDVGASDAEKETLVAALDKVFEEKGISDMPPTTAFVLTVFAVYGPKFQRPEPRKKIAPMIDRVKIGIWRTWKRLTGLKRRTGNLEKNQNASQSDLR